MGQKVSMTSRYWSAPHGEEPALAGFLDALTEIPVQLQFYREEKVIGFTRGFGFEKTINIALYVCRYMREIDETGVRFEKESESGWKFKGIALVLRCLHFGVC